MTLPLHHLGKRAASSTPPAFREVLLSIARGSR